MYILYVYFILFYITETDTKKTCGRTTLSMLFTGDDCTTPCVSETQAADTSKTIVISSDCDENMPLPTDLIDRAYACHPSPIVSIYRKANFYKYMYIYIYNFILIQ